MKLMDNLVLMLQFSLMIEFTCISLIVCHCDVIYDDFQHRQKDTNEQPLPFQITVSCTLKSQYTLANQRFEAFVGFGWLWFRHLAVLKFGSCCVFPVLFWSVCVSLGLPCFSGCAVLFGPLSPGLMNLHFLANKKKNRMKRLYCLAPYVHESKLD